MGRRSKSAEQSRDSPGYRSRPEPRMVWFFYELMRVPRGSDHEAVEDFVALGRGGTYITSTVPQAIRRARDALRSRRSPANGVAPDPDVVRCPTGGPERGLFDEAAKGDAVPGRITGVRQLPFSMWPRLRAGRADSHKFRFSVMPCRRSFI